MKNALRTLLLIFAVTQIALGQVTWLGLTPGRSTITDADRRLGSSVAKISPTLLEYSNEGQKVYVQVREGSGIIDRVEVLFVAAVERSAVISMRGIGGDPAATKWDSRGRLEEYFGAPHYLVLTHAGSEASTPLIRIGYYSSELFSAALLKPVGTPIKQAEAPAVTQRNQPKKEPKSFRDIDLIVPKGDKSETKSVRLLFDGENIIIDADRGEKVYKEFAYPTVVSGEYSYSSHPRWKTAIGAAVLIGVFALPIFFMKSKKHWLTIKTADDFAILRLDKDNYKMVVATFETTVGKRVETVKDSK